MGKTVGKTSLFWVLLVLFNVAVYNHLIQNEVYHGQLTRMNQAQTQQIVSTADDADQGQTTISNFTRDNGLIAETQDFACEKWFLGSIRISKTGSTSLENTLHNAFHNVHRLPRFFPDQSPGKTLADQQTESGYHMDSCFYGHLKDRRTTATGLLPHHEEGLCHHLAYKKTKAHFEKRAPFLQTSLTPGIQRKIRLQHFTMIREPFEHLSSYFYYSHTIFPSWKKQLSEKQNECVVAKDFQCWLARVHEEGAKTMSIPYQFGQLSSKTDLAGALRLATSPADTSSIDRASNLPEVIVLINDCFETSLRLLVDLVPQVFYEDVDDECSQSDIGQKEQVVKRMDRYLQDHQATHSRVTPEKSKEKNKNSTEWNLLKEQAKIWFADEYTFYKESIRQFQLLLNRSSLEGSHVGECNAKLNSILAEQ